MERAEHAAYMGQAEEQGLRPACMSRLRRGGRVLVQGRRSSLSERRERLAQEVEA